MFILKSKRREVWGERQEVHVKQDWSKLTVEERERKALQILDMCRNAIEMRKEIERFKREGPRPIVYDPTDVDELAEAAARKTQNGDPEDRR